MKTHINIRLFCEYCGEKLIGTCYDVGEIHIDPCEKCIEGAEKAGCEEGRNEMQGLQTLARKSV